MAVAQELQVNPSNTAQRIIVWSNGWLQPLGGATGPAQAEARFGEPAVAPAAPTFYESNGHPVCAAKVTTWGASPAGYTMNIWGSVYGWGGATQPSDGGPPNVFLFQPMFGYYSDFVPNPANNGQGYALNYDGDVIAYGTGTPGIAHSQFLTGTGVQALRLYMDWTSKRYWVLDSLGRVWGFNGGNNLSVDGWPPLTILWSEGINWAMDLYDMSAAASGFIASQFGYVYRVGSAINAAPGSPGPQGYKIWQDVRIISPSSPTKLAVLNEYGGIYEYVVSSQPTVTVQLPLDPQTTTSRPTVGWTVFDPERDATPSWDLAVFTSAQYSVGGFDPGTSTATYRTGGTAAQRSHQIQMDLPNATYRAYVRVLDASGLLSNWAFKQWVQNVVRPNTPTVTPTVLGALTGISLALHVNPAGLPAGSKFGVQYQDADDTTWRFVKGGFDVTPNGSGDATVIDYGAGYGVQRTYRALTYVYDANAGTWNGSDFSTTANATITDKTKWVLSSADDNNSIVVKVQPGISFKSEAKSGIFWPSGRQDPIVIRDSIPKYAAVDFSLWVLDNATRVALEAILLNQVLLLRGPFGNRYYLAPTGTIDRDLMLAAPLPSETTPIRDANQFKLQVQRVARPRTGPTVGPLAV